jgi:hypothetical protein
MVSEVHPLPNPLHSALTPENVLALLAAPVVLPLNIALQQPTVRAALKESLIISEQCRQSATELAEHIDDLMAEANAELIQNRQTTAIDTQDIPISRSTVAEEICAIATHLNSQTLSLTQGWIDLPTLAAAGLGVVALRQLLTKGIQLDALPWYVLAWYAFDSFVKLHDFEGPGARE